jgi:RHS repeat-associated protein
MTVVTGSWWATHRGVRSIVTLLLLLAYVTTATAGPVIFSGDDFAQHGSKDAQDRPQGGWLYIQKALQNLQANVTRPGNNGHIAALGSAPSSLDSGNAGAAIGAAAAAANLPVDYYFDANNPARPDDLSDFFQQLESGAINPAIIWLAGTDDQVSNDLNPSESNVLTANAQKLADFVNSGGGLMAHGHGPVAYGWLTTLMPGLQEISAENENFCQSEGASLTEAGRLAFPGLSDSDIGGADKACHGHFEGNLGALQVLAYDGFRSSQFPQGRMFIIGGANTIITGQISLAPLTAPRPLDTTHTVTASVNAKTSPFGPLANVAVTFSVTGGPNIGKTAVVTTAANGEASFTYTGDHGVGTDQIRASFLDGTTTRLSNLATVAWKVLCDTNNDNMVDTTDINAIFAAIGSTVSAGDLRDAVVDGLLTVNDARACVLRCAKPQCANNAVPVANAGPDQEVTLGPPVTLNGSGSSDPNPSDVLHFSWGFAERPASSTATFVDPTVVQPQFIPDKPGTYIAQLIVNDGAVNSAPDTVQILAVPPIVAVPNVVQMTQADAQHAIETAGLRLGTITLESSETVAAGSVLSQSPTGGTNAPGGSAVNLVVSSGRPPVTVPDVTGLPQAAAAAELLATGLTTGEITLASSNTIPAGYVISQHPHEGENVPGGTAVDLVISSGGPQVTVPDVRGQMQQAAQSAIEAASLLLGSVTQASSATVPAGKVITQTPAAGSSVPAGSIVSLVVSLGTLPGGDLSRPTVQLTVMPPATAVDDTVTLTVSASDGEGVTSTTLRVNGTIVPLDATGHATFSSATPGIFSAVATAQDAAGNEGRAETEFRFQTTGDSTQPTVSITAPADGAELTLPTTITGSVSDDGTLVRYLVQASRAGKNEFFTVASGAGPVTNGVLGTFDPTLLVNGAYELRVSVEDASGNVATVTRSVEVDGQAKVGNFSLSFDDLTIPVAGIPITITRTYDSRNKSKGDFGAGWTLAVKDLEVLESGVLGSQWEQQADTSGVFPKYTLQPKRPRFVTVRFPDGRLHTFTMKVTPSTQNLIPIDFPTASFTPAAGTTSTLVSLDANNLIVNPPQPGNVTLLSPNFATYDPTRYKLTDKEGMVYVINQATGLEKITDLNGHTITFTANGIIHSAGPSVTFTRDAQNRLTKITDPMGHTIEYAYDFYGDLTAVTDQEDYTTQFRYNSTHGLLDIVDPRGVKVTRNEYDADGRLRLVKDADNQTTDLTHDLTAHREVVTDRLGHSTTYEYDARGNVTKVTDPLGQQATLTYDSQDNQLTAARPSLAASISTYDARNNLLMRTSPAGRTTTYTYNTRNQVLTSTDAAGRTTSRTYDAKGNLTAIQRPLNRTTTLTYDAQGNVASVTDSANRTTHFTYDTAGRVTRQTLPDGRIIQYSYDANGNVTSLTPPGRPGHQFTYSQRGLEQSYLPPTPQPPIPNPQTTYAYNANGQVTQITRPDGQAMTMTYDDTGRLLTQALPTGQRTYTYDTEGQQTSVSGPGSVAIATGYDAAGRLTTTTWSGPVSGSVSRAYDPAGRVATQSVAGGQPITFAYDDDDILTSAGSLSLTPHPQTGVITDTTLGAVADHRTYNDADELTSYQATNNGSPVFATPSLQRDNIGRITQKTETLEGVTATYDYAYDAAGRLTTVKKNGSEIAAYAYDTNANRLSHTTPSGTVFGTYDDQDRLLSYGGTTYTYTANGELQSKTINGQTTQYTYDALGNLRQVALPSGTVIEYVVDGKNRRIGKKVNGTLVQGWLYQDQLKPIAELDGSGNVVAQFIYASCGAGGCSTGGCGSGGCGHGNVPQYMVKGGVTYRILSDHLGSPRVVVNTTDSTIAQRMDYDEFGNVLVDTSPGFQPFGFVGGLYDQHTKLTRFGARDYDAETGRWTAKDPIRFESLDMNLYGYVLQDPINAIDPSGNIADSLAGSLTTISIQQVLVGTTAIAAGILLAKLIETVGEPDMPFTPPEPFNDPNQFLELCRGVCAARFPHNPMRRYWCVIFRCYLASLFSGQIGGS